jgi:hypothetical protein
MDNEERERRATGLLNDPLFKEMFEVLRKDLMNRWESSVSTELEDRDSIWLAMRLLDRLYGHIQSIVETGHMNKVLKEQHPFI